MYVYDWKGTNGVSTNGVTAKFMPFEQRDLLGTPVNLTYLFISVGEERAPSERPRPRDQEKQKLLGIMSFTYDICYFLYFLEFLKEPVSGSGSSFIVPKESTGVIAMIDLLVKDRGEALV